MTIYLISLVFKENLRHLTIDIWSGCRGLWSKTPAKRNFGLYINPMV